MFALGSLLRFADLDASRATGLGQPAHGDPGAMSNLGLLLQDSDPQAADDWAEAAAIKAIPTPRSTAARC